MEIEVSLVQEEDPEGNEGNEGISECVISDIDEIKITPTHLQEPSAPSEPSAFNFPPKCYRCDSSNFNAKREYDYHCVRTHPGLPAYPGPADIRESRLTPQGMSWENNT